MENIPVDQQKIMASVCCIDWRSQSIYKTIVKRIDVSGDDVTIQSIIEKYGASTILELYLKLR